MTFNLMHTFYIAPWGFFIQYLDVFFQTFHPHFFENNFFSPELILLIEVGSEKLHGK